MKVCKISYDYPVKLYTKGNRNEAGIINRGVSTNPFTENIYHGRDLVTFKAKNFESTVTDNYFKLPQGCTPDDFQLEAARGIYEGKNVITEAPTGTGKTAIAYYAAKKNMEEGKKTFYTTPLKALSNQKLLEFKKIFGREFGEENVGILTGERRENPNAPIVIMTTEVYRNMAHDNMYEHSNPIMENIGTVIFDEMHYMDDPERGTVWEEAIMYTPEDVQMLGLSATIGNAQHINNWIDSIKDKETKLVSMPEEKRHVPLVYDSFVTSTYLAEEKQIKQALKKGVEYDSGRILRRPELSDYKTALNKLSKEEKLPAIFFVFSKRFSREILDYLEKEGPDLTTKEEKKEISEILDNYSSKKYLGSDINIQALKKGYAVHNAGILPEQKEMIEELFQKKLLKVVIATETLAAGINMPAKTVLLSRPYKPTSNMEGIKTSRNEVTLTPNEFKQMSGRAGRRGIDEVGYVYTMSSNKASEEEFEELKNAPSNPIRSKYNPDYSFLSGYYQFNENDYYLSKLFEKSFKAYDEDEKVKKQNAQNLLSDAAKRTQVLLDRDFLKIENGIIKPTIKSNMASKIKGFDTLSLVETVADKTFKGLSPEALAAVVGMIANPADYKDTVLSSDSYLNEIFYNTSNSIYSVYDNMAKSVSEGLNELGFKFENFKNLNEVLETVQNIEVPDTPLYDIKMEMYILNSQKEKLKTINSNRTNYSFEEVYKLMKMGYTIPSGALEKIRVDVESYKKKNNIKSFDSQITDITSQIKELETNSKESGRKTKKRNEREISELSKKIDELMLMKYIDENIYNEIGENYKYTKEHSLKAIDKRLQELQSEYSKLTLKDRLCSQIQGMIGMEKYAMTKDFEYEDEENKSTVAYSISEFLKKTESVNLTEVNNNIENPKTEYGISSPKLLYNWARLNKINPDGISNWKVLLRMYADDFDEGAVYKKVTQTADLLGQIRDIAQSGIKMAESEEERKYYINLKNTAIEAKKLIINDPVHL